MLIFFTLLNSFELVSQPIFQWAQQFGGPTSGYATGYSVVTDINDNVYTTGYFSGTVDFDPGTGIYDLTSAGLDDIFVSKLDANGNFIWAKRIGNLSYDEGRSIKIGNNGIYLSGYFYNTIDFDPGVGVFNLNNFGGYDIFILKLDFNGDFIWAKNIGGANFDQSYSLCIDTVENIYTTGYFCGTVDFDPGVGVFNLVAAIGDPTIFVCKLDSSGNFIWAKSMGGNDFDLGTSITIDSTGVYTTGYFKTTSDFDPGINVFNLNSVGDADIFISKLDLNGNFLWAKSIGGSNYDVGRAICLDPNGNIYTTGNFRYSVDFDPGVGVFQLNAGGSFSGDDAFILKLNRNGDFLWAKAITGNFDEIGFSINTDVSGNVYTAGWFNGTADFDPSSNVYNENTNGIQDIFISKLSSNGDFLCVATMGGTGNDGCYAVHTNSNGYIYSTGTFSSTVDFNPAPTAAFNLTSTGYNAIFVTKSMGSCLGTGLNDYDASDKKINIYPNPVKNILNLNIIGYDFSNSELEILNCLGQQVFKTNFKSEVDIAQFNKGVYLLRVKSDLNYFTCKFIKE